MKKCTLILLAATLAVAACNKSDPAANASASANMNANAQAGTGALIPEHGGTVATSAGLITEVVNDPTGRLTAYVRGPQGAIANAQVSVKVRTPDGNQKPVAVAWDAQANAYVGYVWGVPQGQQTVDVTVGGDLMGVPPQTVSSTMNLTPLPRLPPARYGGTVEVIGQYAVEIVPSRSGEVAFFVMNMDGTPVPAGSVQLPSVIVDAGPAGNGRGNARGRAVALAPQPAANGGYFVARAEPGLFAQAPSINIYVDINVNGQSYTHAEVPHAVVVSAMPPAVSVPAVPVVQRPVQPGVFAGTVIVVGQPPGIQYAPGQPAQGPNSANVVVPASVGVNMPAPGTVVNAGPAFGPHVIGPGPAPAGMQVGVQINGQAGLPPPGVPGLPVAQPGVPGPAPVQVNPGALPPPNVMMPQPTVPGPAPVVVNPGALPPPNVMMPQPGVPGPAPVQVNPGALPPPNVAQPVGMGVRPGVSPVAPPVPQPGVPPVGVAVRPGVSPMAPTLPQPGVPGVVRPGVSPVAPPPAPAVVAPPPGPRVVAPPPGPVVMPPPAPGTPPPVRVLPNPLQGQAPVAQPGAPVQGGVRVQGSVTVQHQ